MCESEGGGRRPLLGSATSGRASVCGPPWGVEHVPSPVRPSATSPREGVTTKPPLRFSPVWSLREKPEGRTDTLGKKERRLLATVPSGGGISDRQLLEHTVF